MPKGLLTGSRIRERRNSLGMRQSALAQTVGISPAYLNLIEHNRRRIGGKILLDLADALGVEVSVLTEGAQAGILAAMRNAAAAEAQVEVEEERIDEFAGRFPGWASLVAARQRRIEELEHIVETLNDRLAHDPQLASSVHEVLSVVTSIRSASAILASGDVIEKDWQARFHRNLYEDSQRLSGSAQALVAYLDASAQAAEGAGPSLPLDHLEHWLTQRGFHIDELEGDDAMAPEDLLDATVELASSPADRGFALGYLKRYRQEAQVLPMAALMAALAAGVKDPADIAQRERCDLATVLRRLACLPPGAGDRVGLVICDSSGAITFRRPVDGFSLPRFGANCALWPLFQTLSNPNVPLRTRVEHSGHIPVTFQTYSVSRPIGTPSFDRPNVLEATMLIMPDGPENEAAAKIGIGPGCRICARRDCFARREPSIMTEGF